MRLLSIFRRDDGAAAVEFAMVVPIFLLLVFGIIEYSRAYYTRNYVATAVREGARLGATLPFNDGDAFDDVAAVKAAVVNYATPFGGAIDPATITVDDLAVGGDEDHKQIVVAVTGHKYSVLTAFARLMPGLRGNVTISDTAIFRWERSEPPPSP